MLQYVIAGLVLGGIYAIASAGLVITYVSSGILNFAFGALAYFVARFYYYLHVQENWGIGYSALLAILVAGPALGVLLYFMLFRFLRLSSPWSRWWPRSVSWWRSLPEHADLWQRGDLVGTRARARAGPSLRLLGCGRDVGPGHRLRVRRGHGRRRLGQSSATPMWA
jgi:hypothetical protein